MTYVIAEPCVDLKDKACINADFFEQLGSPGGASKVGLCEHDPAEVKGLRPVARLAQ
jgi:hypothetical protein